jgi:hypothetical protein
MVLSTTSLPAPLWIVLEEVTLGLFLELDVVLVLCAVVLGAGSGVGVGLVGGDVTGLLAGVLVVGVLACVIVVLPFPPPTVIPPH